MNLAAAGKLAGDVRSIGNKLMDSGRPSTSPAIAAAEAHFGSSATRYEKGSGLDIIAAQRDVVAAKSARLKAARIA
jgi:hypothetical protein